MDSWGTLMSEQSDHQQGCIRPVQRLGYWLRRLAQERSVVPGHKASTPNRVEESPAEDLLYGAAAIVGVGVAFVALVVHAPSLLLAMLLFAWSDPPNEVFWATVQSPRAWVGSVMVWLVVASVIVGRLRAP